MSTYSLRLAFFWLTSQFSPFFELVLWFEATLNRRSTSVANVIDFTGFQRSQNSIGGLFLFWLSSQILLVVEE